MLIRKKIPPALPLIIFSILVISSCVKDNFRFDKIAGIEWTPTIAAPLVNSTLDVYDIIAGTDSSDLFIIDPQTGFVGLIYTGQPYSLGITDLINIPDQKFSESITLTPQQVIQLTNNGNVSVQVSKVYTFTESKGVKIHELGFRSGTLSIDLTSDFQHNGTLTITFPTLTKNGIPLSDTFNINYSGQPVNINKNFDFSGYILDLTNGGASFNELPIEFTLELSNSGNPTILNHSASLSISFSQIGFSYVKGDFGQQSIPLKEDSINIEIFNNTTDGVFELKSAILRLEVMNSFGMPVSLDFKTLKSINLRTGEEINLTGFPNPILINAPTQMGDSALTEIVFDTTNTPNITTLVSPAPKYLIYEVEGNTNPNGTPPLGNFVTDESKVRINSSLELPLHGLAYGFGLTDTVPFSINPGDSAEIDNARNSIESILIRTIVYNGFPINGRFQIYLTDVNYNIIDSLTNFSNNIIESGIVNNDGRVVEKYKKTTEILFQESRVPNLFNAEYMIIRAEAESYNAKLGNHVKIYEDYTMNVRVGMKVNGRQEIQ